MLWLEMGHVKLVPHSFLTVCYAVIQQHAQNVHQDFLLVHQPVLHVRQQSWDVNHVWVLIVFHVRMGTGSTMEIVNHALLQFQIVRYVEIPHGVIAVLQGLD